MPPGGSHISPHNRKSHSARLYNVHEMASALTPDGPPILSQSQARTSVLRFLCVFLAASEFVMLASGFTERRKPQTSDTATVLLRTLHYFRHVGFGQCPQPDSLRFIGTETAEADLRDLVSAAQRAELFR